MPVPLTAASTPQKYMKDCMLHYIEEDNCDAGFDVADALSEHDIIEQIKKKESIQTVQYIKKMKLMHSLMSIA